MTRCALDSTKLNVRPHLDDHIIKPSEEIVDRSVASLETFYIGIQPESDVADAQVDQPVKERDESVYPLGVGNGLSWRTLAPKL